MPVVGVWQKNVGHSCPLELAASDLSQRDRVNMIMVMAMVRILAIWDLPRARHFPDLSLFGFYKSEIDNTIIITALHMRRVGTEKLSNFSEVSQLAMAELSFVLSQSVSRGCAVNCHMLWQRGMGVGPDSVWCRVVNMWLRSIRKRISEQGISFSHIPWSSNSKRFYLCLWETCCL